MERSRESAGRRFNRGDNLNLPGLMKATSKTPKKRASKTPKLAHDFRHRKTALRAALYARVSTGDQQTLPMQLKALRRYAGDREWQIVSEVCEIGSGTKVRPKREEIVRAARRKEIDVVLVWRLDRWGRSVADLALTMKELHQLGIAFVSFTEAIDLTTPPGRAMAGLLAVFAEFEQEVRRERILAGIAEARAKGTHLGRPATITKHREEIQRLFSEGKSKAEIARHFKIARSTVRLLLAN